MTYYTYTYTYIQIAAIIIKLFTTTIEINNKLTKMLLHHPFVQSIAHINDSGTFESSFEVKHIQTTPLRLKHRCHLNECERENLRRFVKEFEHLNARHSSGKSTPKQIQQISQFSSNIGNTTSQSFKQTPQWARDSLKQKSSFCFPSSPQLSSRSNSPNDEDDIDMGFKPLANCEESENDGEQSSHDDILQLNESMLENTSANTSYDLHPPLLPSFNVTPPKQQRNAAYELARFLRGSFHVKRAKITHLRRSLSDNENLQDADLPPAQLRNTMTEKTKKKVLEDATNRTRGSSSNICVSRVFNNFFYL